MKEFIEKLIGRLEEEYIDCFTTGDYKYNNAIDKSKEIANQLAEEYKGNLSENLTSSDGWIPCSERLPEENIFVLVESEHGIWIVRLIDYGNHKYFVDRYNDYSCSIDKVLAWQPLPQKYEPKGEKNEN